MNEIKSIQLQLEKEAILLSSRIENIYSSLEELQRLTQVLFDLTPYDSKAISKWIEKEQFIDRNELFISKKRYEEYLDKTLDNDIPTCFWPSSHKDDPILNHRFFALRNIGKTVNEISKRLNGVTVIYYQDTQKNACIGFPYTDMEALVPSSFDWNEYHSCISVNPQNNPNKEIQWSVPNIDYGGEGLISIASIPLYKQDEYIGVWSMDVPHKFLYKSIQLDTHLHGEKSFITDYHGNIIVHPTIDTSIDKEKGSFIQVKLSEIDRHYKNIDLTDLVKKQKGELELLYDGKVEYLVYQVIPKLEWIIFISIPKDEIEKELEKQNIELEKKVKEQILSLREKDAQLLKQAKMASLAEMLENIAHQWRQPLSVISTISTGMQLKKQHDLLSANHFNEACDSINENVQYLSQTIDTFRDYIYEENEKSTFNLSNEINSLLSLVNPIMKSDDINIELSIDKNIELFGYKNEIKESLMNIINNARNALNTKKTNDKYIFINTKIKENKLIITIKDNASGIPNEIIDKVFDPYFTTKHKSRGTGLGLYMTHKLIVDRMNGEIFVNNIKFNHNKKEYSGAEFTIVLPLL